MLNRSALVDGGKKGAAVIALPFTWQNGDIARQLLVLRAQTVGNPGTHRGYHVKKVARMQLANCHRVVRTVALHSAQNAKVIGVAGRVGQEIAHMESAFTRVIEA